MESKSRSSDDPEPPTRKVTILSSSKPNNSAINPIVLQPDYLKEKVEEGEWIESNSDHLGSKRKFVGSGSGGGSRSGRVITESVTIKMRETLVTRPVVVTKPVLVAEYNKPKNEHDRVNKPITKPAIPPVPPAPLVSSYNTPKNELAAPQNINPVKTVDLRSFLGLASDDLPTKLAAFKNLPRVASNAQKFRILSAEITKTRSPLAVRLAALDVLGKLGLGKHSLILDGIIMLLKLSYEEGEAEIRCKALKTLETFFGNKTIQWAKVNKLKGGNSSKKDDPFDVMSKLPDGQSTSEVVFLVLSHVAANDTHRDVRMIAMELLGKLPGSIGANILVQSTKKDVLINKQQQQQQAKVKLSKAKQKQKQQKPPPSVPLLCCGVFAHGIEDQFVKIRFAALISLFSLLRSKRGEANCLAAGVAVFLDALLDECDLIRLAALKFLRQLGELVLTVQSGLESLLAVLDDQNGEIRVEALKIIGSNLILGNTGSSNNSNTGSSNNSNTGSSNNSNTGSSNNSNNNTGNTGNTYAARSATIMEIILRTQWCIEAALIKYPEMELLAFQSIFRLMRRSRTILEKSCPQLLSCVLLTEIPKFMLPSSLLPTHATGSLTDLQLIMQIPFLVDEKVKRARLVKIVSRMRTGNCLESLEAFTGARERAGDDFRFGEHQATHPSNLLQNHDEVKLFKLLVLNNDDLLCRYEAEKHSKPASYFLSPSMHPLAYFRINSVKMTEAPQRILVDDYRLIGAVEHVRIAVVLDKVTEPFVFKYGTTFVATLKDFKDVKDLKDVKIINLSNNQVIYN